MAGFVFQLQTVLNVKTTKEDLAKREYVKLELRLKQEIARLQLFQAEWEQACRWERGSEIANLLHQHYYRETLLKNIDKQTEQIHRQELLVEEGRGRLLQAMKDRKVLEKLKERQAETYKEMVARRERCFLDELGVIGFNRERR